jgi:NAD(P)H-quinone oxidoreductase subunit 5
VLQSLSLLPNWAILNKDVAMLLTWSSIFGCSLGGAVYLGGTWSKPIRTIWKPLQDLLAYDFYTAKLYRFSIVFAVDLVSKAIAWLDRYIVDGAVNLVGLATVFSGQGLKYNVSGQSQFYMLTIVVAVTLLLGLLTTL